MGEFKSLDTNIYRPNSYRTHCSRDTLVSNKGIPTTMKDILGKEILEGRTIAFVGSGQAPRLNVAEVLEVEEKRIRVTYQHPYKRTRSVVWLSIPEKIAIVEER